MYNQAFNTEIEANEFVAFLQKLGKHPRVIKTVTKVIVTFETPII
jgi:hypothetical protein